MKNPLEKIEIHVGSKLPNNSLFAIDVYILLGIKYVTGEVIHQTYILISRL